MSELNVKISATGQPGDYSASMTVDGSNYGLNIVPDGYGNDLLQGSIGGLADGDHAASIKFAKGGAHRYHKVFVFNELYIMTKHGAPPNL